MVLSAIDGHIYIQLNFKEEMIGMTLLEHRTYYDIEGNAFAEL